MQPRQRILSKEERQRIVASIPDQSFRDFIFAIQSTGCRPSEVARINAADVQLEQGIWLLQRHKMVHKTGRPRIIFLTPDMVDLTRKLAEENPLGPIFLNKYGKAYTANAIRCRFRRLRKTLDLKDVVSYSYRHTYATEALVNGVGIAQVSELLGHTSTDMVMRHHGHLAQHIDHMREAALKAVSA